MEEVVNTILMLVFICFMLVFMAIVILDLVNDRKHTKQLEKQTKLLELIQKGYEAEQACLDLIEKEGE